MNKRNEIFYNICNTAFFFCGVGISRIASILIGLMLARYFNGGVYTSYVSFITLVNLISSIPLMGTTQLILSDKDELLISRLVKKYIFMHLFMHLFCWLACVNVLTVFNDFGEINAIANNFISLYAYSLGYCLTGVAVAAYNKQNLQARGGLCWIYSAVISGSSCALLIEVGFSPEKIIMGMSLGWLIGGVICIKSIVGKINFEIFGESKRQLEFKSILRDILVYGAPSVIFLLGFYLLISKIEKYDDVYLQGAYSLGYQLFSVSLFFPGVLGNVFIPRFVNLQDSPKESSKFINKIFWLYLGVAVCWCMLIWLTIPWLLSAYKLPNTPDVIYIIFFLQLASIIAAIQALLNQLMAAKRLPYYFLIAAFIWLIAILTYSTKSIYTVVTAVNSLMLAYTMCLICSILLLKLGGPMKKIIFK